MNSAISEKPHKPWGAYQAYLDEGNEPLAQVECCIAAIGHPDLTMEEKDLLWQAMIREVDRQGDNPPLATLVTGLMYVYR